MNPDEAEILALNALRFLAHSDEDLDRFVALSGIHPADLKSRADDPDILAAVLDFILADDKRVIDFCESASIDARTLHAARRALPGA